MLLSSEVLAVAHMADAISCTFSGIEPTNRVRVRVAYSGKKNEALLNFVLLSAVTCQQRLLCCSYWPGLRTVA